MRLQANKENDRAVQIEETGFTWRRMILLTIA
jgi:hypothetical protein